MILLFISICCYSALIFYCLRGPRIEFYRPDPPVIHEEKVGFVRSLFRELGQRQLRKNDRRLFAAGDRRAFA